MSKKALISFFVLLMFVSCQSKTEEGSKKAERTPEQEFQALLNDELNLLKKYNQPEYTYVDYLSFQLENYEVKNSRVNKVVRKINKKFQGLSSDDRVKYQLKWQKTFQLIIDQISILMRNMIKDEVSKASPESLSKSKELNIRLQAKEKNAPKVKLIPRFYSDG